MATTEKTPLWLELKKDYIDDNFSKLQVYLRDCDEQGREDAFYATTIELFRERISDLLRDISERPIYADEQERQQLTSNVSMLATYLLADGDHSLALPAYVAFMNGLRQMNPSLSDLIVKTLMQRIRHEKVTNLGFSWKDLEKMGTELFAHNVCKQAKFDTPLSKPQLLTKYGTALLTDDKVVAIHIDPHPYRVVELNGTAYLRVNAESRIMPEQLRLQMLDRKVFTNKNRAAAISLLQQAYSQKRCAILHSYASNNSGGVEDRLIEPYDVRPEDNLVISYDIKRNGTRVFNFNRIGYVEILADKPWTNTERHKPVFVDVFHMSDDNVKIHISLQLDLMAKNLLVEEFPRAKDYLTGHKGDENIWYFDTDVCRLEGIGRFYIGLANHITILEGEPLKQYAAEYAKKYLLL